MAGINAKMQKEKKTSGSKKPDIDEIYAVLQPTRRKIVRYLKGKKDYPSRIETGIGIDRKIISYHLQKMEDYGIVECQPGQNPGPGSKRLVLYYKLTKKGKHLIASLGL